MNLLYFVLLGKESNMEKDQYNLVANNYRIFHNLMKMMILIGLASLTWLGFATGNSPYFHSL